MAVRVDPDGIEAEAIHELVDFADKDLLEIGCGNGRMTWSIVPLGRFVLTFDLNEEEIGKAAQSTPASLQPKVVFQVADITGAGLPPASCDVAVYSYSL